MSVWARISVFMRGTEIDIVWSMTVRWVADCSKDLLYDILDNAVILETLRGEFLKRHLQMISSSRNDPPPQLG